MEILGRKKLLKSVLVNHSFEIAIIFRDALLKRTSESSDLQKGHVSHIFALYKVMQIRI